MPDNLTDHQLFVLSVTERVNSCVSLIGILFILLTYGFCPSFHKPINRLIFFATWANLGVVVAALISVDGYRSSIDSLCKFQAFMVQMFLGVDAYWAFCMAINVYLAFFKGWSVSQLRALDVRYLLACYGLSFIPAFVFIFVNQANGKGPIYGPAQIWCWIASDWDWLRLLILYAFIWLALILSLVVYLLAARVIWKKRSQLDGFLNPWNESPFVSTVTTQITVTSETRTAENDPLPETNPATDFGIENDDTDRQYSINIGSGVRKDRGIPKALNVRSITRDAANNEVNAEAWLYARVAFLFFFALAITWIPSSINRIYDVIYPDRANFGLAYVASIVFPLQGFWNVIVYILTSRTACKDLWNNIRGRGSTISSTNSRHRASGKGTYKRSKSGSWDADEEDLNPRTMTIQKVISADVRTAGGRDRFDSHDGGSQGSTVLHDYDLSRPLDYGAERGEIIQLPRYHRNGF